ncbi:uncharacterized protein LOC108932337 isoform X3 [Scleropages formosus]|uniref:uncharacterized protein LOC108932337 isoform X3 n=1 Tax=Scleropages formosus TaxID=113540 RepID=UPI000878BF64|nr:uncharacterized protein LOC108932337 isoform X3 [Scleropages formosus]
MVISDHTVPQLGLADSKNDGCILDNIHILGGQNTFLCGHRAHPRGFGRVRRPSVLQHLLVSTVTRSVIRWPNVKFMGNIAAGDFSIILSSVTYERSGTYLCRFRPPHSPVIYKNYTQLTVIYRRSGGHAGHELSQNRSQADASDNIVAPSPWLLSMYCYIVGLLLVVVTGWALAWWFRWRRALAKNGVQRKDERMTIHKGDPQPPHGNQDTYVTLQRCKNPPPPSPQREGIYVTMVSCGLYVNRAFLLGLRNGSLYSVYSWKQRTPGAVDPTVQSGRSRKGIPLEWYARTDVTLPGKISSG